MINPGSPKEELLGARMDKEKVSQFETLAEDSGVGKSELLRQVVENEMQCPPIWVKTTKWTFSDLHEQMIEFRLRKNVPEGVRVLEGTGQMILRKNSRGEIAVDIFADQPQTPYSGVTFRIWLSKEAVENIELSPNPNVAKFRLLG